MYPVIRKEVPLSDTEIFPSRESDIIFKGTFWLSPVTVASITRCLCWTCSRKLHSTLMTAWNEPVHSTQIVLEMKGGVIISMASYVYLHHFYTSRLRGARACWENVFTQTRMGVRSEGTGWPFTRPPSLKPSCLLPILPFQYSTRPGWQ